MKSGEKRGGQKKSFGMDLQFTISTAKPSSSLHNGDLYGIPLESFQNVVKPSSVCGSGSGIRCLFDIC
jgi:hypothetical protein